MAKAKQVTSKQAEATVAEVKCCERQMSGLEVKTGRRFKQGHDARRKSILIEIEYLEEGQGAMAEELIQRGWRTQAEWDERLGRRIDKRVAKDTKAKVKAEKAAAREAEKQARAQAKVAKPQLPPKARRRNG